MSSATAKMPSFDTGCIKSLKKLPPRVTTQFMEMMTRYMAHPEREGLNLETVRGAADSKIKSMRVDQNYRAIAFEQGEAVMFVHVNEHDKAYKWAEGRSVKLDHATNRIRIVREIEQVDVAAEGSPEAKAPGIFDDINDKRLLRLGITSEELPVIRTLTSIEALEALEGELDTLTFNIAYALAAGYTDEEVDAMAGIDDSEEPTTDTSANFEDLIQTPESRQTIFAPESIEQLKQLLEGELDGWRVWLHPDQRKFAYRDYNGPAMVRGGAGTGKTVVAMHRAKYLADQLEAQDAPAHRRILVTTFTTSLSSDIEGNLKTLCPEHLSGNQPRIEVINLDRWVSQFLKKKDFDREIVYFGGTNSKLERIWAEVFTEFEPPMGLTEGFVKAEWAQIVQAKGISDKRAYIKVSRAGRGTPLNREKRLALWQIFEAYRAALVAEGLAEPDDAYREVLAILESESDNAQYAAVIVDESQDMGEQAFKLIRAMVPEQPESDKNSLFLVGDAHQRIYNRRASMSACGINIRGRSRRLKLNYRTTHQIRAWAVSILEGVAVDDLDEGFDTLKGYVSIHQGQAPELVSYDSTKAELDGLVDWIKAVQQELEVEDLANVGVVTNTKAQIEQVATALGAAGLKTFVLKAGTIDDRTAEGVRLCTMHRAKGLEFAAVAIPLMSADKFPPKFELDSSVDGADLEDKTTEFRSLLHVAATRAKGHLRVSWSGLPSSLLGDQLLATM